MGMIRATKEEVTYKDLFNLNNKVEVLIEADKEEFMDDFFGENICVIETINLDFLSGSLLCCFYCLCVDK